jgi:hypothetical protein
LLESIAIVAGISDSPALFAIMRQLSRIPAGKDVQPDPPRLMQGRKLCVIKPASSAVYNKHDAEMLVYFR